MADEDNKSAAALPVGHVPMPTFPSGHRNLTEVEVDALIDHYSSDDYLSVSGGGWKRRAAVAELKARRADTRDARQAQVIAWAKAAFTEEQATSLPQRGIRLLEEAIEAFQAAGGDRAQAHELINYVFDRPPGLLGQELGGVGVTLLALAAAAGLSADTEERYEVNRVLSKPAEHWAARNKAKNDAGFLAADLKANDRPLRQHDGAYLRDGRTDDQLRAVIEDDRRHGG